ncbi:MAG TPA: AraC family transcriptional regulator [Pyrinomonadaceae bacterium]|jgi:AraC-like DNA-binding protein|nr:AraC family transcriptional regulator [Pyrinomonadaceae bacterium]
MKASEEKNKSPLEDIAKLIENFPEGVSQTVIPYLSIMRCNRQTSFEPGVITPSFCVIVRGQKRVYLGEEIFEYSAGDSLSSLIAIPATGMVVGATNENPYIGLKIDLNLHEIASVITEAGIKFDRTDNAPRVGAFVGRASGDTLKIFLKMIRLLGKPEEVYLAELLKKEMIFRLLTGEYRHLFFQKSLFDQTANGVGRVIEWIRRNYTEGFSVDQLARSYGMSVSALHHKFKAITTMSPLQYQKQLRLQEARRLLVSGQMDATTAALEVGYDSASQFNREYRRLFGLPPLKDVRSFRQNPVTA